jgi:hypothetical protein
LPCLQKNLLENPHIFPTNTSSHRKAGCPVGFWGSRFLL